MIDFELMKLLSEQETLPFLDDDPEDPVAKSGVLSPSFGSRKRRQNELVSRLKARRQYAQPVRGGKKKKRRSPLSGNLTRRRKGGSSHF